MRAPKRYARLAIAGTAFFAVVMYVAFAFIQPELNPLHRFGSEYAVGRGGWLMKAEFFAWAAGILSLAVAMAKGLDSEARSRSAVVLLGLAAAGLLAAGIFDTDLQVVNDNPPPPWVEPPPSDEQMRHVGGSFVFFLSLMLAAGLASRRLRLAGRLRGVYRALRHLAWLAPVSFVAFVVYFVPQGLAGIGQRIFLLVLFAWVVLAGRGIETGAFSRTPCQRHGGPPPGYRA
jgi:hypothetical protein